jgi:hypothetical protein
MPCEFHHGREIIYSRNLWIEKNPWNESFIIYFTKGPQAGLRDEIAYEVPPESDLFQKIESTFEKAKMRPFIVY